MHAVDTGVPMAALNLRDFTILTAQCGAYDLATTQGILRSLGANKLLEAKQTLEVLQILSQRKIDILLCDIRLPPFGGLELVRAIRKNAKNENRAVPIFVLASNARENAVTKARDAGANLVIQTPLSPANVLNRVQWVLLNPRPFVDFENYAGPDRRFKIEGYPEGVGRRKSDTDEPVAAEAGPALTQGVIDDLFNNVRTGAQSG